LPNREGDISRRDAPFIGFVAPNKIPLPPSSGEGKNRKVENESWIASRFASLASSNKHKRKSPTCADVPATEKLPSNGDDKSTISVAVAEKTPTRSATKGFEEE
jgi:hypothetical protein